MDKIENKKRISISRDEQEQFVTGNPMPADVIESYIWFAVENSSGGVLYLFTDELDIAADMARKAGLNDLAERIVGMG